MGPYKLILEAQFLNKHLIKNSTEWYESPYFKDSANSSSRFFVSEYHSFHNFVIFDVIDFKSFAVVDNNIAFDLQK